MNMFMLKNLDYHVYGKSFGFIKKEKCFRNVSLAHKSFISFFEDIEDPTQFISKLFDWLQTVYGPSEMQIILQINVIFMFVLILYVPVNKFSVMSGQVFLA